MDEVQRLIDAHPDLCADELASAYEAMGDEDDEAPRAYETDERVAHALILSYLQHVGTSDWNGNEGEKSIRSRMDLIDKAGLVEVLQGDSGQHMALLPLGVFRNLMADLTLLSCLQARRASDSSAQDMWLRVVQARLAQDAARQAWLADNGQKEAD